MHIQINLRFNSGKMIIKRKIFEKYEEYTFSIPYSSQDRVLVKKGDLVKMGDNILRRKDNVVKYSFYLPEQMGVPAEKCLECITCIDGELVTQGTIIAERVVAGGLNVKKLISPSDGVIDLSRIKKGYLDILGEEVITDIKSSFSGKVVDINPVDGIVINSPAYAFDIKLISEVYNLKNDEELNKKVFGEFVFLGDGKDLLLKAEDIDYHNKIVFVGKYLHPSLLNDLFNKGASFVLTYSMDYRDFRTQGLPVGVLGGFGEIFTSEKIIQALKNMIGSFAIVDYEESQIFFLNGRKDFEKKNDGLFVYSLINSMIRSMSLANYGMLGTVVGVEEGEKPFLKVKWENDLIGIISIANVEFLSL